MLKKLFFVLLGLVGLLLVVVIGFALLFNPNSYRDQIAQAVKEETGRDLVIEGDLDVSFFPWLAIKIGETTLANADGFGDEPFLTFTEAKAGVQVMPLVRGEGLVLGDVLLDGFELNLAVAANGRNNWEDLEDAGSTDSEPHDDGDFEPRDEAGDDYGPNPGQEVTLAVSSIKISNAAVRYEDAQASESYRLTDFNFETGSIGGSDPIDVSSRFNFELQPADLAGDFAIETVLVPEGNNDYSLGDAEISTLGLDATVSISDERAHLQVDAFSLKTLMQRLNIEPPVTADPNALSKIILDTTIAVHDAAIAAENVELVVDDTTFKGDISVARDARGTIGINLAADEIDLDRYMEPAAEASGGGGESVPVEIPVDLIRALNVRGKMTVESATLSGLAFDNVELGLTSANGNMRLHPIAADLFEGKYQGDVRINAAGSTPSLSVNENITDVSLAALAEAMFEQQNITGRINGSFQLGGQGADLAAIQRSMDGNINMELIDGTWEGTDVWYQLRRARALFKKEPPPEPQNPPRTEFSNVRASGPVVDGVFKNNEIFAELPYMQITGKGEVDFLAADVDYRLTARVLERPEFVSGATDEELAEFTEAEIPLRVTGPLLEPSIKPDIQEMLKKEVRKKVEEEVKERLLEKLLGN